MVIQSSLILFFLSAAAYGLGFVSALVVLESLAVRWRRTTDVHWTERARIAFVPGCAVLSVATALPPVVSLLGGVGLGVFIEGWFAGFPGFLILWFATTAGVMTVRYRWLREVWGSRVTLRSWLGGYLVIALGIFPHLIVTLLVVFCRPKKPGLVSAIVLVAGILAVAFFAAGGGVLLLRLIGVAKPAPDPVRRMVEDLAQHMKLPGKLTVLELEWAQVNAVAWMVYGAVGFSRPMLEVMTADEVRAVAAHELAHILEPRWARTVRVAHLFAYLPIPPLFSYGGGTGLIIGFTLLFTLIFGYPRFSRAFERRADRMESEAIANNEAYMRSMVRLHEANVVPAVMPGSQTHPHLYDRLLANGHPARFPATRRAATTNRLARGRNSDSCRHPDHVDCCDRGRRCSAFHGRTEIAAESRGGFGHRKLERVSRGRRAPRLTGNFTADRESPPRPVWPTASAIPANPCSTPRRE
jgi:Zn-dependent protease with chaperone function